MHNNKMYDAYMEGEEGIDYVKYAPGKDPREVNEKKLRREINAKFDVLAVEEPEIAAELKKRVLSNDTEID